MSKKRDLIKQWRNRADERSAMADSLSTDLGDPTNQELRKQHIECLRTMADTFNLCADELDKA